MKFGVKILAIISISTALISGFTACTSTPSQKNSNEQNTKPAGFQGFKIDPYESPYTYTTVDDSDFENMEAQQLIKLMGNGINLGNTLEATNNKFGFDNEDASVYETAWGQPRTTKAMFMAMKEAGFDSVRIPVAWTHTMDWSRGDFEISQKYFERVAQVVNWALECDLYVVMNDHWDYQWWGMFSHDEKLAWKIYESMWTQIGEYFKDYSYKLIFEGANEEVGGRFNDEVNTKVDSRLDSSINYQRGYLSESQCYILAAKVTQKFVDIIRSQGGNNKKRFLLIPGYDTDINKTCSGSYKMPADTTNSIKKLIISVHYYTPSTYCILSENASWGTVQNSWGSITDYNYMNIDFRKMTKFIDEGYGVIIGEYAVAQKKNSNGAYTKKEGMEKWLKNVLDNCDAYNYCPFLWDCNTFFKKNGTLGFTDAEVGAVFSERN